MGVTDMSNRPQFGYRQQHQQTLLDTRPLS